MFVCMHELILLVVIKYISLVINSRLFTAELLEKFCFFNLVFFALGVKVKFKNQDSMFYSANHKFSFL